MSHDDLSLGCESVSFKVAVNNIFKEQDLISALKLFLKLLATVENSDSPLRRHNISTSLTPGKKHKTPEENRFCIEYEIILLKNNRLFFLSTVC